MFGKKWNKWYIKVFIFLKIVSSLLKFPMCRTFFFYLNNNTIFMEATRARQFMPISESINEPIKIFIVCLKPFL